MSVGKTRPHTRRINRRHGLQDLRSSTQCFEARLGRLQYCQVGYAQPPCACLPQSPRRSAQVAAAPYFVLTPLASVAMDSHLDKINSHALRLFWRNLVTLLSQSLWLLQGHA